MSMMTEIAAWFVLWIALHRTLKLVIEIVKEFRLAMCLCSKNVSLYTVKWTNHSWVNINITALVWATFWLLVFIP